MLILALVLAPLARPATTQNKHFQILRFLVPLFQAVSPRSRFAMLRTDLRTLSPMGPTTAVKRCLRPAGLSIPGILLFSCAILVTTECHAQDLADAAKQERARQESQRKNSKHVYTEEDLKRAQILTPEDRAQFGARKNQAVPDAG